jgi:hypothetical protein
LFRGLVSGSGAATNASDKEMGSAAATGIEPNCKQAGRSQGNQPLLQKEAQAFIAVKDSLHEALVGGTTCKLQRGKDLRNGLAAVALQFDLSGE